MPPTGEQQSAACRLLDDLAGSQKIAFLRFEQIEALPATAAILGADPPTQVALVRECIDRIVRMKDKLRQYDVKCFQHEPGFPWEARLVLNRLLRRKLPWTDEDLSYLVTRTADPGVIWIYSLPHLPLLVNVVRRALKSFPLTEELRQGLLRLRAALQWSQFRAAERRLCEQLSALASAPCIQPAHPSASVEERMAQ